LPIIFNTERTNNADRIVKLIHQMCNEFGTETDAKENEFPFIVTPMFMYMLKLIKQVCMF